PADDHRLVGERGIIALFDGRIKGVAIHMGDRHARQFAVARDTRRTAAGAAHATLRHVCKAIAAKTRHRIRQRESLRMIAVSKPIWPAAGAVENVEDASFRHGTSRGQSAPVRTSLAFSICSGATPAWAANARSVRSLPEM